MMKNPPHPGETLREDVLPALGLTVTEAAAQLGVTRAALSRVLNRPRRHFPHHGPAPGSMAGSRERGRADLWLSQQTAFDLWQAREAGMPQVTPAA